jgi:hypothetical protein
LLDAVGTARDIADLGSIAEVYLTAAPRETVAAS